MQISGSLKILGLALPIIGLAWKWLRNHNDHSIQPPSHQITHQNIERLVREGQTVAAVKAIRKKYGLDLRQAKARFDQIKAQQGQKP